MSISFGSWKVLEAKRVVICIGLWGLEDLCLDGLFCVRWVLLRYERLPFASQLGWLGLRESGAAVLPPPLVLLGKHTLLPPLF